MLAYKTLSLINAAASDEVVKLAHRRAVRAAHPDLHPDNGDASIAADVNVAYSLLRTAALRETYAIRRPKNHVVCPDCKGRGGRRYPVGVTCTTCGGEGYVLRGALSSVEAIVGVDLRE